MDDTRTVKGLLYLIAEIRHRLDYRSDLTPKLIHKFAINCCYLLRDERYSDAAKITTIIAWLQNAALAKAFTQSPAYRLLFDLFMHAEARKLYFTEFSHLIWLRAAFFACYSNRFSILSCLVKNQAMFVLFGYLLETQPQLRSFTTTNGQNLAHMAAAADNTDALKYLIEIDPGAAKARDSGGNTPLHLAVLHKRHRAALILAPLYRFFDLIFSVNNAGQNILSIMDLYLPAHVQDLARLAGSQLGSAALQYHTAAPLTGRAGGTIPAHNHCCSIV